MIIIANPCGAASSWYGWVLALANTDYIVHRDLFPFLHLPIQSDGSFYRGAGRDPRTRHPKELPKILPFPTPSLILESRR
jgi:hypothetical protein